MNIEDMNIEQFNKFCGELLATHAVEAQATTNMWLDEIGFCKEVAFDGRFRMFVEFDLDGVPTSGFVMDEKVEGDSYDIEKDADFMETIRLPKEERAKAIVELINHLREKQA